MDEFFRQQGQTNTFGFDRMRRELNNIRPQVPGPLHAPTAPPGISLPSQLSGYVLLNFRMVK